MVPEYFIQSVPRVVSFLETQNVSKIDSLQKRLNFLPDIRAAEAGRVPRANAQGILEFGVGRFGKIGFYRGTDRAKGRRRRGGGRGGRRRRGRAVIVWLEGISSVAVTRARQGEDVVEGVAATSASILVVVTRSTCIEFIEVDYI